MTALPHTLPARTTRALRRVGFTFADDGSYAACLASAPDGGWHPEVWRLGTGVPEPHTLALPDGRWESLRSQLLALPDGRVLVCRHQEDRHEVVVLSRTDGADPGEGGSVAVEQPVAELYAPGLRLLPLPAAAGPGPVAVALATATTDRQGPLTTAWLLFADDAPGPAGGPAAGPSAGPRGPQRVAEIPGLYGGGLWLDTGGRMLALDRVLEDRVKSVVVDLAEGTVSPLLEITPESNDRLALADPATGLIVLRSDAPGTDRLGWGILGENVPVRFPECLNQPGAVLHPVAVEPSGTGADPSAAEGGAGPGRGSAEPRVAVQIDRGAGSRLALWQPSTGRLQAVPVPPGRLGGVGHWSASGLRMPYSAPEHPAGVATVQADLLRGAAELPPVSVPAPLPMRLAPLSPDTPGRPTAPHAAPRLPTTTSVGELPGQRLAALPGPGPGQAPEDAGPEALTPGAPIVPPVPPMPPVPPVPLGPDATANAAIPAVPAVAPGGPEPARPRRRLVTAARWVARQPGWRLDGSTPAPDGGDWHGAHTVQLAGAAGALEAVVYGGDAWLTAEHLVLALHGGPADAWRLEFDPALQRMAAEGLAVVAPNQRGSIGYGESFAAALQNSWGGPDLEDVLVLLDGVATQRAALGLEPPALFGVSYGAFLALLAAATAADQVVRCAVVAPFLSGARLLAEASPAVQALTQRLGGAEELRDARGPRDVLRWCHRLVAPLLLVHGDQDEVVPVGQSRTLRQELLRIGRMEGTDFRYVEAAGAGHDLLAEPGSPMLHELLAGFLRDGRPAG